jgi:hypothetical protein
MGNCSVGRGLEHRPCSTSGVCQLAHFLRRLVLGRLLPPSQCLASLREISSGTHACLCKPPPSRYGSSSGPLLVVHGFPLLPLFGLRLQATGFPGIPRGGYVAGEPHHPSPVGVHQVDAGLLAFRVVAGRQIQVPSRNLSLIAGLHPSETTFLFSRTIEAVLSPLPRRSCFQLPDHPTRTGGENNRFAGGLHR